MVTSSFLAVLLSSGPVATVAAQDATMLQRVRSSSAVVTAAIERGAAQSPVFRDLIATINGTDGLVYVEEGACGNSVRACLLPLVTVAGPYRVLRIRVEPRKAWGCELVGSIGHELRHAIEALSEAGVRSAADFVALFQRIGVGNEGRYETNAAVRTGLRVEREACRHGR